MRFHVPQFIEVEDKVFGPFTVKQFIYLAGGGAIIFIFYVFLPLWLTIILALPIGGLSIALAFYKIHGQPFIRMIENALSYLAKPKLYLWQKKERVQKTEVAKEPATKPAPYAPRLTKSKLKDLAWSLDIQQELKK